MKIVKEVKFRRRGGVLVPTGVQRFVPKVECKIRHKMMNPSAKCADWVQRIGAQGMKACCSCHFGKTYDGVTLR